MNIIISWRRDLEYRSSRVGTRGGHEARHTRHGRASRERGETSRAVSGERPKKRAPNVEVTLHSARPSGLQKVHGVPLNVTWQFSISCCIESGRARVRVSGSSAGGGGGSDSSDGGRGEVVMLEMC